MLMNCTKKRLLKVPNRNLNIATCLSTGDHELDVEHFVVHKVVHQRLKAPFLAANIFEAVERFQNDLVTPCQRRVLRPP